MPVLKKLDPNKIQELREEGFRLMAPDNPWLRAARMDRAALVSQLNEALKDVGNDGGEALDSLVGCWKMIKSGFDGAAEIETNRSSRSKPERRVDLDQAELLDIAVKALDQLRRAQRQKDWNPGIGFITDSLADRMNALLPSWEKLL